MAFVVYASRELTSLVVVDADFEEAYLLSLDGDSLDAIISANRYVADSLLAYDVYGPEETVDGLPLKVVVAV